MIEVSKFLLLGIGELLLVSVVVSIVLVVQAITRSQRDRSAIKKLVARVKEDRERREIETRKIMQELFGFEGEALDEVVKKIVREERVFYQILIDVYLNRNSEAIKNLCVDYEQSVDTYRTLSVSSPVSGLMEGEAEESESESYQILQEENKRLTEELKKTMETMGTMLSEYSQMFSGDIGVELDKSQLADLVAQQKGELEDDPEEPVAETSSEDESDVEQVEQVEDMGDADDDAPTPPPQEADHLEELKELDDEIASLDLTGEIESTEDSSTPSAVELDETMIYNPEESDEVVDLEDVLGDDSTVDKDKKE